MKLIQFAIIIILMASNVFSNEHEDVNKALVYPGEVDLKGSLLEGFYINQGRFTGTTCTTGKVQFDFSKKASVYLDSAIRYQELCNILTGSLSLGYGTGAEASTNSLPYLDCSDYGDSYYSPSFPSTFMSYENAPVPQPDNPFNPGNTGGGPGGSSGGITSPVVTTVPTAPGVTASAGVRFLKFSRKTETSFTITFGYNLELGTQKVTEQRIRPEFVSMFPQRNRFPVTCGEHLVYYMKRGANAFVTVKIEAGTNTRKREIEGKLGVSYGLVSLGASLGKLKKQYGSHISIDIRAIQSGGDANQISEVIGDGKQCDSSNNFDCRDIIMSIHRYFSQTLPSQFNDIFTAYRTGYGVGNPFGGRTGNNGRYGRLNPDEVLFKKSVITEYGTQSYCKLPGDVPPSCTWVDVTPFTNEMRKYINSTKNILTRLNSYLMAINVNLNKKREILSLKNQQSFNLNLLKKISVGCTQDSARCEEQWVKGKALLKPFPSDLLDRLPPIKNLEFFKLCFQSKDETLRKFKLNFIGKSGRTLGILPVDFLEFENQSSNQVKCIEREVGFSLAPLVKIHVKAIGMGVDRRGRPSDKIKCGLRKRRVRSALLWNVKNFTISIKGRDAIRIGDHNFSHRKDCREDIVKEVWKSQYLFQ